MREIAATFVLLTTATANASLIIESVETDSDVYVLGDSIEVFGTVSWEAEPLSELFDVLDRLLLDVLALDPVYGPRDDIYLESPETTGFFDFSFDFEARELLGVYELPVRATGVFVYESSRPDFGDDHLVEYQDTKSVNFSVVSAIPEPAIPEPASIICWAGLGLMGAVIMLVRKRRAAT